MIDLKTIAAGFAVAGALAFSALGLGVGVASAAPISPGVSGTPLPQDDGWWGHGHGHGHGHWGGGDDWGGPWWGPGGGWGYGGGVNACVSASGPWGFVSGSACI